MVLFDKTNSTKNNFISKLNMIILSNYSKVVYILLSIFIFNVYCDIIYKFFLTEDSYQHFEWCACLLRNFLIDYSHWHDSIISVECLNWYETLIRTIIIEVLNGYKCFITRIFSENNYFNVFSIVVSMASVEVTALTMMFGNFKISGIGSNTILKYLFKKEFLLCRLVIFITPFILLLLMLFNFLCSYFALFLLSITSLIYLLHLCISVFVDRSIKFNAIPNQICNEILAGVRDNDSVTDVGKFLYSEFIHSVENDTYNEFCKVYVLIFCKLIEKSGGDLPEKINTLMKDTKKYLLRNSTDKDDVIRYYFDLNFMTVSSIQQLNYEVLIIILKNSIECSGVVEVNDSVYAQEIDKFYSKIIKEYPGALSTLKISLLMLFQIEVSISEKSMDALSNIIVKIIERLIENIIGNNIIFGNIKPEIIDEIEKIKNAFFNNYFRLINKQSSDSMIDGFSFSSDYIASCVFNVWSDLCYVINQLSLKSRLDDIEGYFDALDDCKNLVYSKVFTIYNIKKDME